jgi:hypothetical protein
MKVDWGQDDKKVDWGMDDAVDVGSTATQPSALDIGGMANRFLQPDIGSLEEGLYLNEQIRTGTLDTSGMEFWNVQEPTKTIEQQVKESMGLATIKGVPFHEAEGMVRDREHKQYLEQQAKEIERRSAEKGVKLEPGRAFRDAFVQSMSDKPAMMLEGVQVYTPGGGLWGSDSMADKAAVYLRARQDPQIKQKVQERAAGKLWPVGEGKSWYQIDRQYLPETINAWATNIGDQIPIMLAALTGKAIGKVAGKGVGAVVGGAAAIVTGGPDPTDVVTAPAVAAVASKIVEHLGGAAPMIAMEAGGFMDEAESLGIDKDIAEKYARRYGVASGAVEYAESLWMLAPYKGLATGQKQGIVKFVLKEVGGDAWNGIEEITQGALQTRGIRIAISEMKERHPEYSAESPTYFEDWKREGAIGFGVAAVTRLPGHGLSLAVGRKARSQVMQQPTGLWEFYEFKTEENAKLLESQMLTAAKEQGRGDVQVLRSGNTVRARVVTQEQLKAEKEQEKSEGWIVEVLPTVSLAEEMANQLMEKAKENPGKPMEIVRENRTVKFRATIPMMTQEEMLAKFSRVQNGEEDLAGKIEASAQRQDERVKKSAPNRNLPTFQDATIAAQEKEKRRYDDLLARAENGDEAAWDELNAMTQQLNYPTYEELLDQALSEDPIVKEGAIQAIQEGRYRNSPAPSRPTDQTPNAKNTQEVDRTEPVALKESSDAKVQEGIAPAAGQGTAPRVLATDQTPASTPTQESAKPAEEVIPQSPMTEPSTVAESTKGKSGEEIQSMLDDLTDEWIKKYGDEAAFDIVAQMNGTSPIPASELAKEKMLLDLRNRADKPDRERIRGIVFGVLKDNGVPEDVATIVAKDYGVDRNDTPGMEGHSTYAMSEYSKDIFNNPAKAAKDIAELIFRQEQIAKGFSPEGLLGMDSGLTEAGKRKMLQDYADRATRIVDQIRRKVSARTIKSQATEPSTPASTPTVKESLAVQPSGQKQAIATSEEVVLVADILVHKSKGTADYDLVHVPSKTSLGSYMSQVDAEAAKQQIVANPQGQEGVDARRRIKKSRDSATQAEQAEQERQIRSRDLFPDSRGHKAGDPITVYRGTGKDFGARAFAANLTGRVPGTYYAYDEDYAAMFGTVEKTTIAPGRVLDLLDGYDKPTMAMLERVFPEVDWTLGRNFAQAYRVLDASEIEQRLRATPYDAILQSDAEGNVEYIVLPWAQKAKLEKGAPNAEVQGQTQGQVVLTNIGPSEQLRAQGEGPATTQQTPAQPDGKPATSELPDDIYSLIDKYNSTGRTATWYPRKKVVSVDGRTMSKADAIKKMQAVIESDVARQKTTEAPQPAMTQSPAPREIEPPATSGATVEAKPELVQSQTATAASDNTTGPIPDPLRPPIEIVMLFDELRANRSEWKKADTGRKAELMVRNRQLEAELTARGYDKKFVKEVESGKQPVPAPPSNPITNEEKKILLGMGFGIADILGMAPEKAREIIRVRQNPNFRPGFIRFGKDDPIQKKMDNIMKAFEAMMGEGEVSKSLNDPASSEPGFSETEPRLLSQPEMVDTDRAEEPSVDVSGKEAKLNEMKEAFSEVRNSLRKAKRKRIDVRRKQREERSRRTAIAESVFQKAIQDGKTFDEADAESEKALGGQLTNYDSIYESIREKIAKHIPAFENRVIGIKRYYERKLTGKALNHLIDGHYLRRHEAIALQKHFPELSDIVAERVPLSDKFWDLVQQILSVPRTALVGIGDIGGILRQGFYMAPVDPAEYAKYVKNAYKAFYSEENAQFLQNQYKNAPLYELLVDYGLELPESGESIIDTAERDEEYAGVALLEKVPYLGTLVRASERAHVIGLNSLRYAVAEKMVIENESQAQEARDKAKEAGASAEEAEQVYNKVVYSPEQIRNVVYQINNLSGRYHVQQQYGQRNQVIKTCLNLCNALFFSPRFVMARTAALFDVRNYLRSETRVMTIKGLAGGMGASLLMGTLIKAIADHMWPDDEDKVQFDWDPLSTDGFKLQIGNTRFDLFAGYQQYARFIAQTAYGKRRTATGKVQDVARWDLAVRFLRSKGAPIPGLLADWFIYHENLIGKPVGPSAWNTTQEWVDGLKSEAYDRLAPMLVADTYDSLSDSNAGMAAASFAFAFNGGGVQTYKPSQYQQSQSLKDEIANSTFGKEWDNLKASEQKQLRKTRPEIEEAEITAKATSYRRDEIDLTEQNKASSEVASNLSEDVRKAMKDVAVSAGVSKRLGQFRLNDSRFAAYKAEATKRIEFYVSREIGTARYQNASLTTKKDMIEKAASKAKEQAKNQIDKLIEAGQL